MEAIASATKEDVRPLQWLCYLCGKNGSIVSESADGSWDTASKAICADSNVNLTKPKVIAQWIKVKAVAFV